MHEYPEYVPEELQELATDKKQVVLVRGFRSGYGENSRDRVGVWWSTDIFYVLDHSGYHKNGDVGSPLRIWVSIIDRGELARLVQSGLVKEGGKSSVVYQFLHHDPPNPRPVSQQEIQILDPLFKDGLARGNLREEIYNNDALCEQITRSLFLRASSGQKYLSRPSFPVRET